MTKYLLFLTGIAGTFTIGSFAMEKPVLPAAQSDFPQIVSVSNDSDEQASLIFDRDPNQLYPKDIKAPGTATVRLIKPHEDLDNIDYIFTRKVQLKKLEGPVQQQPAPHAFVLRNSQGTHTILFAKIPTGQETVFVSEKRLERWRAQTWKTT